jgi:hypothetical protein
MPEDLIFPGGLIMMVAVAGQFIQKDASKLMIAVPGMLRRNRLWSAGSKCGAAQTIVLNVVYGFQ